MKQRIVTALILIPVLLIIALVLPQIVAAVVWGLLLMVSAYELLYCTGLVRHPRMVMYSSLMAFASSIWSFYGANYAVGMLVFLVFWILLFSELMANHVKVSMEMVMSCVFAGAVVPYLLCAVIRILGMSSGRYMVLIPFVVAFCADTGAYFIGTMFGRHKLAPVVSPNKTIEGVLGGLGCAVLGMLIYAMIMHLGFHLDIHYGAAMLYGLMGAAISVFGDLCFSIIKRQSGIKDYGHLFPGHGGVMDRFDSLVTVAPLIEAAIVLIPVVL